MLTRNVFIPFIILVVFLSIILQILQNSDSDLNITEAIEAYGYKCEVHEVQTEDGYILTLHRISYGVKNETIRNKKRTPVLLMHGIFNSAVDFICLGPEKSLGFILADNEFDVWIGNSRGTTWSKKHVSLDSNNSEAYWNFTISDLGLYDVPAKIDYILNATNSTTLQYVGYSQGGIECMMYLSLNPEYVKKISLLSLLAPALHLHNLTSEFGNFLIRNKNILNNILFYTNTHELLGHNTWLKKIIKFSCSGNPILMHFCLYGLKVLNGGVEHLDKEMLPIIMTNSPGGAGAKQFIHALQFGYYEEIVYYDYGKEENLKVYGQEFPLIYNFSNVTVPTALYYSSSDQIVNPSNIEIIKRNCKNIVKSYEVPESFYHFDFIWGKNAVNVVYLAVLDEMLKYT